MNSNMYLYIVLYCMYSIIQTTVVPTVTCNFRAVASNIARTKKSISDRSDRPAGLLESTQQV